ncbi:hypothetical protein RR48_00123, partial [Papilio machaon]
PNGVIIDNGVGGGIVGSGDAGVHRPPVYPVHIQRGHIPGESGLCLIEVELCLIEVELCLIEV